MAGVARKKPLSETEAKMLRVSILSCEFRLNEQSESLLSSTDPLFYSSPAIPVQYSSHWEAGLVIKYEPQFLFRKHFGSSVVWNSLLIGSYTRNEGGGHHLLNACDMVTASKILSGLSALCYQVPKF